MSRKWTVGSVTAPRPNPNPSPNPTPTPHPNQVHGTPAKNKRGDLPTILITPEERGFDPQVSDPTPNPDY